MSGQPAPMRTVTIFFMSIVGFKPFALGGTTCTKKEKKKEEYRLGETIYQHGNQSFISFALFHLLSFEEHLFPFSKI